MKLEDLIFFALLYFGGIFIAVMLGFIVDGLMQYEWVDKLNKKVFKGAKL